MKRGQITIFMILGLVILFISLALVIFVNQFQKQQLRGELESIMTSVLGQEGLRIYVNDCLQDGLEEALLLLGKQGRLWRDQVGGVTPFDEGFTGIRVPGETDDSGARVFYGIVAERTGDYPCNTDQCTYRFPNTTVGFGEQRLITTSLLERDLARYLTDKTLECVQDFTTQNISKQAVLKTKEIDVNLDLREEGIGVTVEYPITLGLDEEEYFSLSSFDFFYRTKFFAYVTKTVLAPLSWDQQFVDFPYDETTLKDGNFVYTKESSGKNCELVAGLYKCTRPVSIFPANLPFEMEIKQMADGDLYIFKFPGREIIRNMDGEYIFRIARQNRPPALDYISHCPGPGYDYLLVGDKTFSVTPTALDPDEDQVSFMLDGDECSECKQEISKELTIINITATDETAIDSQLVRVRFAEPPHPTITFKNLLTGTSTLSREDPVCITKDTTGLSAESIVPDVTFFINGETITLREGDNPIGAIDPAGKCVLENYDLSNIDTKLKNIFSSDNLFSWNGQVSYGSEAECKFDFSFESELQVNDCTFHDVKSGDNPFQEIHSCCVLNEVGVPTLAPAGHVCEIIEEESCGPDGKYLTQQVSRCDGQRGNICGNLVVEYKMENDKKFCGNPLNPSCLREGFDEECSGELQNSEIKEKGGICTGETGCEFVKT